MTCEVTCISKASYHNATEHITHLGYLLPDGERIKITVAEAVKRIEANRLEFYVRTAEGSAYLEVIKPAGRDAYIKTVNDHTQTDNLLQLDEC